MSLLPTALRYPVTSLTCFAFCWTGLFFLWWLLAFAIRGIIILWEDTHEPD